MAVTLGELADDGGWRLDVWCGPCGRFGEVCSILLSRQLGRGFPADRLNRVLRCRECGYLGPRVQVRRSISDHYKRCAPGTVGDASLTEAERARVEAQRRPLNMRPVWAGEAAPERPTHPRHKRRRR